MAIQRYRLQGPDYYPRLYQGTNWIKVAGSNPVRWINPSDLYYPPVANTKAQCYKTCYDELHKRRKGKYIEGGPFTLRRFDCDFQDSENYKLIKSLYKYEGVFRIVVPNASTLKAQADAFQLTAGSWGATGWNKFRPIKPSADMTTFLGELRETLDLFKFALKRFKDLGNAYLNYRFGWSPFVGDILKFIKTLKTLERKVAFARKNNGKWLRRGGTIRNDADSVTTEETGLLSNPLNTNYWFGPSYVPNPSTKVVTTTDRVWFVAVMKYYIDKLDLDPADTVFSSRLVRKLMGLELSPAQLWNLLPWSWFQDWFVNWGDLFSNLSNQAYDNLVAKYAYVMRHRKTTTFIQWKGPVNTDSGVVMCGPCSATYSVECKERANASQWGFGQLEDDDLSLRQWAILAALGISRAPF